KLAQPGSRGLVDVFKRQGQGRLNILLVRQGKNTVATPGGDFIFEDGQTMLVFGETDSIYKLINNSR
ncbi:MAG: hypothetical protein LUD50_04760, partial [Clostridia bacterium]|nr:hypothetical protein [Clostridia bacterium]